MDTSNDSSLFELGNDYNRHRLSVPAMSPNLGGILRRTDGSKENTTEGTRAPLLSESGSAASLTSSDRDIGVVPGPMPNYARLPTGIDNIRPHLEQVWFFHFRDRTFPSKKYLPFIILIKHFKTKLITVWVFCLKNVQFEFLK